MEYLPLGGRPVFSPWCRCGNDVDHVERLLATLLGTVTLARTSFDVRAAHGSSPSGVAELGYAVRILCTDVRLMLSCRAISEGPTPAARSCFTLSAFTRAVGARPFSLVKSGGSLSRENPHD